MYSKAYISRRRIWVLTSAKDTCFGGRAINQWCLGRGVVGGRI